MKTSVQIVFIIVGLIVGLLLVGFGIKLMDNYEDNALLWGILVLVGIATPLINGWAILFENQEQPDITIYKLQQEVEKLRKENNNLHEKNHKQLLQLIEMEEKLETDTE